MKDYISWIFSLKNESSLKLNSLKTDINSDKNIHHNENSSNYNTESNGESKEKNTKNLRDTLLKVISRSRKPGDVMKNDNWFVSVWILQRHWQKTISLLKDSQKIDPKRFESIMTDPLFRNLEKAWKSVRNDRQVQQFRELMKDPRCIQLQKDLALETVDEYLKFTKDLWITDSRATLAFWRICNYWLWHAKKVKNNMAKAWANINDYNQVIDYYEKSVSWNVRTKFQKKYAVLWNKNLREFIWEYTW